MPALRRFLPLVALLAAAAQAQPSAAPGTSLTLTFSQSADNDLALAGTAAGELGVNATRLAWRSSAPLTAATRLTYGLDWEQFDFSRPAVSAVPDSLQELALVLGATHRLSPQWLLTGNIRPGLYGDLEGGHGDAFNAPVLLLATWLRSPTLAWAFGLRADGFSERAVLPFVGVNWKFAPDWEFSLGLPRAGVSYTATPDLKWTLGVSVQGGNFHVARDPRPVSIAVGSRLDDTMLDYHEIRAGLSAEWRLNAAFSLNAEAGLITDQKLDYFDRAYTLDGDPTAFFALGLTGRF